MKLAELARDPLLVSKKLSGEERSARGGYIVLRVKHLRAASPDPANIPDAEVPSLRSKLTSELALADAAYVTILKRVNADAAANKLLRLADVDARVHRRYLKQGLIPGTLQAMRQRLVRFIVWWAAANDPRLLAAAKIEDLHLLVDRRLRMAERMLYDVGRVEGWERAWQARAIRANPAAAWEDGWNRMFEYPRLPQKVSSGGNGQHVFMGVCNPDPAVPTARRCRTASMSDWFVRGPEHLLLVKQTRLNAVAAPSWQRPPNDNPYTFFLKHAPPPKADPALAIERLFIPSKDFRARNLLFCDHVIHILHLEALLFSKKKRSPSISFLTDLVNVNSPGWVRIHYGFQDQKGPSFLAGDRDTTFFQFLRVRQGELQIGDHLIVYNHPAYDKATVGGVWKLENAVVVQVYPGLILQGHGTNPSTLATMKQQMIFLFNRELERLRQRVLNHMATGSPNTTIDFVGDRQGELVQRRQPAASLYTSANRRADWWLRWKHDPDKDEPAIAISPARRDLAKRTHKIEYDATHGYFPLWEPFMKKDKSPVTNANGKITRIQPVKVSADMVAAWTWFLPENPADRDKVAVIRPKV